MLLEITNAWYLVCRWRYNMKTGKLLGNWFMVRTHNVDICTWKIWSSYYEHLAWERKLTILRVCKIFLSVGNTCDRLSLEVVNLWHFDFKEETLHFQTHYWCRKNKNLVVCPNGVRNQERLCWRRTLAIYCNDMVCCTICCLAIEVSYFYRV
jgi:hypothetical protein